MNKKTAAELSGKTYTEIINKKYKWNVWAAPKLALSQRPEIVEGKAEGTGKSKLDHHKALTGDDLRDFVDQQLFPYLRKFKTQATSPETIEYKIGEIFSELKNKIQSGYNLREVINLVDELRFRSHKE